MNWVYQKTSQRIRSQGQPILQRNKPMSSCMVLSLSTVFCSSQPPHSRIMLHHFPPLLSSPIYHAYSTKHTTFIALSLSLPTLASPICRNGNSWFIRILLNLQYQLVLLSKPSSMVSMNLGFSVPKTSVPGPILCAWSYRTPVGRYYVADSSYVFRDSPDITWLKVQQFGDNPKSSILNSLSLVSVCFQSHNYISCVS